MDVTNFNQIAAHLLITENVFILAIPSFYYFIKK